MRPSTWLMRAARRAISAARNDSGDADNTDNTSAADPVWDRPTLAATCLQACSGRRAAAMTSCALCSSTSAMLSHPKFSMRAVLAGCSNRRRRRVHPALRCLRVGEPLEAALRTSNHVMGARHGTCRRLGRAHGPIGSLCGPGRRPLDGDQASVSAFSPCPEECLHRVAEPRRLGRRRGTRGAASAVARGCGRPPRGRDRSHPRNASPQICGRCRSELSRPVGRPPRDCRPELRERRTPRAGTLGDAGSAASLVGSTAGGASGHTAEGSRVGPRSNVWLLPRPGGQPGCPVAFSSLPLQREPGLVRQANT